MIRRSAPKPQIASPGASKTGKEIVYIAEVGDIAAWPDRDGVMLDGDFVMKPGCAFSTVYMTPSKQDGSWESEGEEDSISLSPKFVGDHPGDEVESAAFVQEWLGKNVVLIRDFCDGSPKKVHGSPCTPLQLQPAFVGNNEKTGYTMTFQAFAKTALLPGYYTGNIPTAAPFVVADNTALVLNSANGGQYQLEVDAEGASIAVATNDKSHGDIVTLIGSGGADPSTLAQGANVLLKSGSTWTALQGASISLMVFNGGANKYLVEKSRS